MVNRQLEIPTATTELQSEVVDITIVERFVVMANLTNPLVGLLFVQRNGTVLGMRPGILNFPSFSKHLKDANNSYPNVNGRVLNSRDIVLQPGKRTIIWVETQIYKNMR